MSNKLIIASNNAHKISELKSILSDRFDEILSMKEAGINVDPEETGTTFEENSLIKAQCVRTLRKDCAVVADDSGLMVKALDGAPGVYSARFAGDPCNDEANNRKLLSLMEGVTDREAKYVAVITLIDRDGKIYTGKGEVKGVMLNEYRGHGGFGYDPLFLCNELNKTFAEVTPQEKNSVSHRARAIQDLLNKLKNA